MKPNNTLLIILFLLTSLIASAQPKTRLQRQPLLDREAANQQVTHRLPQAFGEQVLRQLNTTSRPGREERYGWINNTWQLLGHLDHTYDNDGNVTETLGTPAGATQPTFRTLFTYTSANQIATETDQEFVAGQWQNEYRIVWTYEANGNLKLKEEQEPTATGWNTFYAIRHDYTYNTAGDILLDKIDQFELGAWQNWRKAEYVQALGGEYTEAVYSEWDSVTWAPVNRLANITWHDVAADQKSSYSRYMMDNGNWLEIERYTLVYGTNGNLVETMQMEAAPGQWIEMSKIAATYDSHFNFLGFVYEINMGGTWSLMYEQLFTLTYDAQDNLIQSIRQARDGSSAVYANELKLVYSQFGTINAAPETGEALAIHVFPNPATHQLTIKTSSAGEQLLAVGLYDLNGRSVLAQAGNTLAFASGQLTLDVHTLPAGVYVLQATTSQGTASHKIIKQ